MRFFDRYDIFSFQIFNRDFSLIFDENFAYDTWVSKNRTPVPHFHETWEIYYVKNGGVRVGREDETREELTIPKKHFFIIPPHSFHCLTGVEPETVFGSIRFSCPAEEDMVSSYLRRLFEEHVYSPVAANASVEPLFDQLRSLYQKYTANREQNFWLNPQLTAGSCAFLSSVLETLSKNRMGAYHPQKAKIPPSMFVEFFMLYASDGSTTVEDLAKSLNYSVSQTNRILLQNFGKTFRPLMNDVRMQQAKYYLLRTDFSIRKISEILGFKETKNFNKSFKISEGVTPKAFRQLHQKNGLTSQNAIL